MNNPCDGSLHIAGNRAEELIEKLKVIIEEAKHRNGAVYFPIKEQEQPIYNLTVHSSNMISYITTEGPNQNDVRKLSDEYEVEVEYYYSPYYTVSGSFQYLKGERDDDMEDEPEYEPEYDDDSENDDDQITD